MGKKRYRDVSGYVLGPPVLKPVSLDSSRLWQLLSEYHWRCPSLWALIVWIAILLGIAHPKLAHLLRSSVPDR